MTTRDELEAAIDAHPDQAGNYLVLADWLQERQDPRGELIVLHRSKDRLAKARANVLQRELGPAPPRHGAVEWFYGFVRRWRAIVDEDDAAFVRATLAHPSLRHATTLEFELAGGPYDERQWLIDAIAEQPRPCWRTLAINSYWRGGNAPPSGDLDLSALWAALPRIAKVRVSARCITPGSVSPTLTSLALDGEVMAGDVAALLAAPALRELELHDVDVGAVALAVEATPVTMKLVLPAADADLQARIRARCPDATFAQPVEGDRYEQIGE